ncbi:MAG TPA: AraC family transcriptional regulator [Ruminiclostridium sp.]
MSTQENVIRNMMHGNIYSFPVEDIDNSPIHVELMGTDYCHESFYIKRVKSDVSVLAFVISGHGVISIENKKYHPSKGNIFILPKDSFHEYHVEVREPWSFMWFNIKGQLLPMLLEVYNLKNRYVCEDCNVQHLFTKALEIASSESIDIHLQQKKITLIIFEILTEIAETERTKKQDYSDNVLIIKNYLDNQIEKKLSLGKLSIHVSMSQRNINRVFKKEVGLTVYDYFLNKKIQLIKTMLSNTNLSVKEIAHRLNYSDVYYFSNLFKKKTGYSPVKYRNKYKQ